MSEANKSTLEKANAAIVKRDFEGFLKFCTEDTEWTFVGERTLKGKDAVRKWMTETYRDAPNFEVHRMVAEADFVIAIGEIVLKDDKGEATRHEYCDVWRFRDGLMAELHAFIV
jgi:ketosteroid isomerase-like protein